MQGNSEARKIIEHRSRRRLLTGIGGVLGLLGSDAVFGTKPALANNGDNVVLGEINDASSATGITNIDGKDSGLQVFSAANAGTGALVAVNGGGAGAGVYATSQHGEGMYAQSGTTRGTSAGGTRNGVHGVTDSVADSGVWGQAVAGGFGVSGSTETAEIDGPAGVFGANLGTGPGVKGLNNSGGAALYGKAATSEGLYAQSGVTAGTNPGTTRNGVHGVTDSPSDSGVWGQAMTGGFGVSGSTKSAGNSGGAGVYGANLGSGPGVLGLSEHGIGVRGVTSSGGIGVLAEDDDHTGRGVALQVLGVSAFNRSGITTIKGRSITATVHPPGGLSRGAMVLALLQNSLRGVWVVSAVPSTTTRSVTISLNRAPGTGRTAHVAWFVVN
jgi:hypothetical protein